MAARPRNLGDVLLRAVGAGLDYMAQEYLPLKQAQYEAKMRQAEQERMKRVAEAQILRNRWAAEYDQARLRGETGKQKFDEWLRNEYRRLYTGGASEDQIRRFRQVHFGEGFQQPKVASIDEIMKQDAYNRYRQGIASDYDLITLGLKQKIGGEGERAIDPTDKTLPPNVIANVLSELAERKKSWRKEQLEEPGFDVRKQIPPYPKTARDVFEETEAAMIPAYRAKYPWAFGENALDSLRALLGGSRTNDEIPPPPSNDGSYTPQEYEAFKKRWYDERLYLR